MKWMRGSTGLANEWRSPTERMPEPARSRHRTHKGNGGRHCCQPPLRRAKDLPVFVTWLIETLRPTYPLSILAHQLRRRFLSDRSLLRGARPTYLTTWPEGSLVARSVRPAIGPKSSVKTARCSAALLGMTSSCVPLCSSTVRRSFRSRVARDESPLFRRLFPAGPDKNPRALPIACRRRSDLWSPAAPSCRYRPSGEAGTAVPIT